MPSNASNNTPASTAATTRAAATTPPTTDSSGSANTSSNNNRSRNNNRNTTTQHTDSNNFEGNIPEIGAVLGLKYEKFKKKATSFEVFLDKTSTYVISNLKDGADAKSIFKSMKDPTANIKSKYKPTAPSDKADTVDKDI